MLSGLWKKVSNYWNKHSQPLITKNNDDENEQIVAPKNDDPLPTTEGLEETKPKATSAASKTEPTTKAANKAKPKKSTAKNASDKQKAAAAASKKQKKQQTSKPQDANKNKNTNGTTDSTDPEDQHGTLFPHLLMKIVDEESSVMEGSRSIVWLPHGKAFRVVNPKVLEEKVLSRVFDRKKMSFRLFVYKLRQWGFSQIEQGPDKGAWYRMCFFRDFPNAVSLIGQNNEMHLLQQLQHQQQQQMEEAHRAQQLHNMMLLQQQQQQMSNPNYGYNVAAQSQENSQDDAIQRQRLQFFLAQMQQQQQQQQQQQAYYQQHNLEQWQEEPQQNLPQFFPERF